MPTERPSLLRAIIRGSLLNFLVSVISPVLLVYSAGVAHSGSFTSEPALALLILSTLGMGFLFVVHEVVLLIPLTLLHQPRFASMTAGDLAVTYVSWVLLLDLFLGFLGCVFWPGGDTIYFLAGLVLVGASVYGVMLFSRSIAAAVDLAPATAEDDETEPTESVEPDTPPEPPSAARPTLLAVRIGTAVATAVPLTMIFWPPSLGATMVIGLVSFTAGHIVEAIVLRIRHREDE